jgi:hypothetical protein
MKRTLYFFGGIIFAVLFSCTEKLEPQPNQYAKVFTGETRKSWHIRSIQLLEEGKGTQTFGLPDCLSDDQYIFYANVEKTYEVTNGSTKCEAGEPDLIVSDSWEFSNANATMTIIMPLFSDSKLPFFVRDVDDDELELEIFLDEDNTASYRINFRVTEEE